MARSLARIGLAGLACALLVFAGGSLLRRVMLGADEREARQRIQSEVRGAIAAMAEQLHELARRAGAAADVRGAGAGNDRASERLFESTASAIARDGDVDAAVTVYGLDDRALAWAGRPTDIDAVRLQQEDAWFLVRRGDFGLRLAYVAAVRERGARVGTTVAERPLSVLAAFGPPAGARDCGGPADFCFPTRFGPVTIELPPGRAATRADDDRFTVDSPTGDLLFTAIAPRNAMLAHERWRRATWSFGLLAIALSALVMIAPLLDARNRARRASAFLGWTLGAAGLLIASRIVLSLASFADWTDARLFSGATYASFLVPRGDPSLPVTAVLLDRLLISPFDFLLTTLAAAALVALAAVAVEQWRLSAAHRRVSIDSGRRYVSYLVVQVGAGCGVAALLVIHRTLLRDTIAQTTLDLVHFSLQPWDASRLALQVGLIVAHATVALLCVLVLRAALARWRLARREWPIRVITAACWIGPLVAWQTITRDDVHQLPLLVPAILVAAAAYASGRLKTRFRHGSQAFRLTLLALAVVIPAFAFYPALFYEAGRAKMQLVETRYADEVVTQRETLEQQLGQSLDEIDALADQLDLSPPDPGSAGATDRAFRVWQQTALADYPITSSIELYDAGGGLVSRFAFNLPEDLTRTPRSEETQCTWLFYGEVAAFFAEERPVLHAGRSLCAGDTPARQRGSIVVHVKLDYDNLPFISSRLPYRQILLPRDAAGEPAGARTASSSFYSRSERDVEFAFYGWSFRPLYPTNEPAWQLVDAVTTRLENDPSRTPFWSTLRKGADDYDVYLLSDRSGIYALGFPVVTPLGHLVNLAELTVLATGLYLAFLAANGLFAALGRQTVTAPALLREIRASFYRKLFLAFVAAVIFPVGALALVTRNYVADEMRASVDQEAVRTASAARRVVEDLVTQLSKIEERTVGLDDNLMVWVSRLIDQDVNVFEGPRLVATSQRNLFASGSLTTRAPSDVFWALQLRNQAATVTHDRVEALPDYLVAATSLTGQQPNTMLTVPLTSGQQQIEGRIATLNRHMLLGALLFILAGAGLGYSMAERISDPVNRLTRATRRISRGDLDARIVARSSDELRRLVEDFNSMAAELQRQQKALEQTHRLEAWAEMARQVAHDIKNPLTPIQLTAEHLRRVHADRGEPLSPVLQECVATILTQVRLLRHIASEFSSFASLPIARPAPVSVPELIAEILEPYRIGLEERIRFLVDVPPALPIVHVDRTLVARALTNLLENALHAMPGRGALTLVARGERNAVRIRVADTGAGMDPDGLARAFEPYFSTKASGTGLGLPIAKRNIELNGGTIAIASERDRGTSVEITLPAGQSQGDHQRS